MRFAFAMLLLLGCSSTTATNDAGDAGCPPGPTELETGGGTSFGVPADPQTGACPSDYCFVCSVLDWPESCPDRVCIQGPKAPSVAYPGQCISLCDAGASDAADN